MKLSAGSLMALMVGSAALLFTGCTTTTTEHRTAVGDESKTLLGFEGGFKRRVASSADASAAKLSIESDSTDLGENLIGLSTRDDVVQKSDFMLGRAGIYAINVTGEEIVLDVYLTGIGRTSDWVGQHSEATYTCVTARATPPNRDSVSIVETSCPDYLPVITTGSVKTVYMPLDDIVPKENEK